MGVLGNYYNYQIAVIFAILIGGCIVLGGTILGIYYICVQNMREDKKKLTSRGSPAPWVESSVAYRPAAPVPASQYAPTPSMQGQYQPQYQQQQYQPYPQQYDVEYNRSGIPSPASVQQPQPLLAPQTYDQYQPQPQYNDIRMQPQQSRSFNQSSV